MRMRKVYCTDAELVRACVVADKHEKEILRDGIERKNSLYARKEAVRVYNALASKFNLEF